MVIYFGQSYFRHVTYIWKTKALYNNNNNNNNNNNVHPTCTFKSLYHDDMLDNAQFPMNNGAWYFII
jgi:hypothetical protein